MTMMTKQSEIRAAFWAAHPVLKESGQYSTRKRQNDYSATVRCDFVAFVDMLARDGTISEALAQRVTL